MSHGSCVAARDGDPAPLATREPKASVAAAASVSRARRVCRNRGLTDIVDLPSLMRTGFAVLQRSRQPVYGHEEKRERHAGTLSPQRVLAITSFLLAIAKASLCSYGS